MYKWNAQDYAQHSSGQEALARELLNMMELKADDRVLDVGCGDGKITALIADRLPQGTTVGVDLSADMIAFATEQYQRHAANLSFQCADAGALPFAAEFSVLFSSAALHWVRDHRPVIAGIARALKPGGRYFLQMGGAGNVERMIAAFEQVMRKPRWSSAFRNFESTYGFHNAADYRQWLSVAGLVVDDAVLLEKWMSHTHREAFVGWLRSAWHPYTSWVEPETRDAFIEEVADEYLATHPADRQGIIRVRMVRLQVHGSKPGG